MVCQSFIVTGEICSLVSTQIYYKHFIKKTQGDGGLQTTLEMSRISVENGE
jgi:hypothetical protein